MKKKYIKFIKQVALFLLIFISILLFVTFNSDDTSKRIMEYKGINFEVHIGKSDKYLDELYPKLDSFKYNIESIQIMNLGLLQLSKTTYNETKSEIKLVNTYAKELSEKIMYKTDNTYEQIQLLADELVDNTQYNFINSESHNPSNLVINHEGVCQAYALLAQKVLNNLDIENSIGEGRGSVLHLWNNVTIDDKVYALDISTLEEQYERSINIKTYLVGKASLEKYITLIDTVSINKLSQDDYKQEY